MAKIRVTAQSLRTAAETLRSNNTEFKNQVTELETTEGNLKKTWEGQANDAFHTAFMNDKQYMDNFAVLIEQYCVALENIATEYENAENINTDTATTRTI